MTIPMIDDKTTIVLYAADSDSQTPWIFGNKTFELGGFFKDFPQPG